MTTNDDFDDLRRKLNLYMWGVFLCGAAFATGLWVLGISIWLFTRG